MCDPKVYLPDYLLLSNTAAVKVNSSVLDSAPDVAICNSDGYFLEIKGKKIVNVVNLNKEIGNDLKCFYFCENEKPLIIYLVKTKNKKLVLIKRVDSCAEIIKIYEEASDYEVGDFMLLGYPQLKIMRNGVADIVKFPVFDTKAVVDQLELETDTNSVANLLAEKLQIVCRHADGLIEEWHNMKRLVQLQNDKENFGLVPVGFSLPLEEYAENFKINSTWIKMIADKLVLGINFFYNGEKKVPGLEFKMYGKLINEYSYKFFSYDDDPLFKFEENPLFSNENISSVLPGQTITVVGAAPISFHNSSFERELKILCYLTSAKLKNYLARKIFVINISSLLDYHESFFKSLKNNCSVGDLQAIKTVTSETKFKIKLKSYTSNTLENILKNNFEFQCVKYNEDKLYCSNSKCLREAFVAFQPATITEQVWKFNFYTSDEAQIYFFVNILYELLPESTTILLDED